MSVLIELSDCKLIRHQRQLNSFEAVDGEIVQYRLNENLFENFKRKQKTKTLDAVSEMKTRVENFLETCKTKNLFSMTEEADVDRMKTANIALMNKFYADTTEFGTFHGANNLSVGKVITMSENHFLIPPNCKFFNKKVEELETCIPPNDANKFDFIVIDPPWKNRYIKRVKKATGKQGYFMMTDDEIEEIPLKNYLKESSIVVIWCTNSETHISSIKEKFLEKWKLKLLSTWQWVKVDSNGELFCPVDGNKKPFEQIFIATHQNNRSYDSVMEKDFLIFSQPSSIHSHKPPLLGEKNKRKKFPQQLSQTFHLQIFSEDIFHPNRCAWKFSREAFMKTLHRLV